MRNPALIFCAALAACVSAPMPGVDIAELRRASIAALESESADRRLAAARREHALGIERVLRSEASGGVPITSQDVRGAVSPLNLAPRDNHDEFRERGSREGPRESLHALAAGGEARFQMPFRGGQSALVMISSPGHDLVLKVSAADEAREAAGAGEAQTSCRDRAARGVALCRLIPQTDLVLNIVVRNHHAERVSYTLLTN
ncbi:hypothetical protein CD351_02520 [Erythrobacter sp. KY5]|uniref:hypothetical protein n=1 Tax=Erythrobacter sp. KY5 TaxID=2011159 RepID=UPI000DBF3232|nr:hypothetical protein [Erythrobacter sp. KY5]AWW73297.1 hypothetical protein CD351_02520 [Erythrobacter sp. KY5]